MTIINLCSHPVHVMGGIYPDVTFPPSGKVARCDDISIPAGYIDQVPVVIKSYRKIPNLPEPTPGVYYIVSMTVRTSLPDRTDLLSPGDSIKDANGEIIACTNLVRNHETV